MGVCIDFYLPLMTRLDSFCWKSPYRGGTLSASDSVVLTSVDEVLSWGRRNSLWPLTFGLACCAIEMMATGAADYDLERFGCGVFRATPRQADLMIVAGTVTLKMASRIRILYEQMPEPKWVISMGSCSNKGGPYWHEGYHVLKGVDRVVPVDVYVPGCPPRPETLIEAVMMLQKKIQVQQNSLGIFDRARTHAT